MHRVSGCRQAVGGMWFMLVAALVPDARAADVLIEIGDFWRYHPGSTEPSVPATEWRTLNFADGGWAAGPTGIGYGDNDDATPLADMQNTYVALFARKSFDLSDPKLLT